VLKLLHPRHTPGVFFSIDFRKSPAAALAHQQIKNRVRMRTLFFS
jgi:hypothetical protein